MKKIVLPLFLVLASFSAFTQLKDESFNLFTAELKGLDYTENGIRYQQIAPTAISQMGVFSDENTYIVTESVTDHGIMYNLDNTGANLGPNIGTFDYRFGSDDGAEFEIISMQADMSAKDAAHGYAFAATITGYRDNVAVASDVINFTESDSAGSVVYVKDSNPNANGGLLTFNTEWNNIDEVRFTGGDNSTISLLMIDELNVPGVPIVKTSAPTKIKAIRAKFEGEVTSDDGALITERGFIYALTADDDSPSYEEVDGITVMKVVETGTLGVFSLERNGLVPDSNYSYVPYAINKIGVGEGTIETFKTAELIPLTITGITGSNKVYDKTTSGSATGTESLSGLVTGDDVILGGSAVFTFASASVGMGIAINTSGYTISGVDSGNYTLTQPTLSGDITAKELTITGIAGSNKVYDKTTSGSATGTESLSGLVTGDDVSLGGSAVFTFASASVGTGIAINTSGYIISGTDSGNYTLTQPTLSGDITAKELTTTGLTGSDKVYDGTTAATANGMISLVGVEAIDDVFLGGNPVFTFASANVGTGIAVSTTGYTISGVHSGNYTLTQPTLSGDITAAPLTVMASDQTKVYGATDPTLTYSITGFRGTDTEADLDTAVSISRAAGEAVGTYTITPSAATDSNYTVSFVTADFSITAAPLTVTASDQTKVYGTTDPTLTYSITGFVNGDTEADLDTAVSISRAAGEAVGTYTITPSAATDSNYAISFVTADFSITAVSLIITGLTGDNKVYDGTTDATASGTPVISGIVSDDGVVLGGAPVFTFTSAELGTDIQITTTGFIITGADSGNYTLTQPTLSADIVTTLGVDDITDEKLSLKLYPNPSINYIRVRGLSEKANYIIYNLLGKEVGKGNIENDEDIAIQDLSNGTYFIRIEKAKVIRFVKM